MTQLKQQLREKEDELHVVERKLREAAQELDIAQKSSLVHQEQLESVKAETQAEQVELEQQLKAASNQLIDVRLREAMLSEQEAASAAKLSHLEDELERARQEQATAHVCTETLDAELNSLKDEGKKLVQIHEELRREVTVKAEANARLAAEASAAESKSQAYKGEITDLGRKLEELQETYKSTICKAQAVEEDSQQQTTESCRATRCAETISVLRSELAEAQV